MEARNQVISTPRDAKRTQNGHGSLQPDGDPTLATATSDWPARPRLAAQEMLAKYGTPREITSEKLVWHMQGPYKRIMVTREEIPHDFPKPHMDFLEHTVEYDVPAEKAGEVITFDASVTINRTAGEVSARCDLEGHNILTLNLVRDIVEKNKSAADARREFGEIVVEDVLGKHPGYVETLQFEPTGPAARFPDEPVIPGSPVRATRGEGGKAKGANDAEVLAFMIALDENMVLAAAEAGRKKMRPELLAYARTLHQGHGEHAAATMKLGQTLGLVPLDTEAVDAVRVKGADGLARLIPLEGDAFGDAWLAAMGEAHSEANDLIGNTLLAKAGDKDLKAYLEASRKVLAELRDAARPLQESSKY